jgi:asparagine synthase (glutamine-hydrolysing)
MCGICGLWSEGEVDGELLRRMAQVIHHRGPDDKGFYLGAGVGLANVRLSIIDLNTGKQPIANEDESVWIVFNGEIYNYPELRRELLDRGHHFKTHTDTEVIVHLYEEYGLDCVRRLRGMFAFALWDERKRRLLLARDPLGQKPLYYSRRPGEFLFGSEIKALLAHRGIRPQLNKRAMHNYISLRYLPDADTMFEGVEKVPAGHFLTVRDGQVAVQPYWDVRYTPKLAGSEAEIKAQVRQQLLDTVQCHLLSDVPLGAFLSGGIDSTLITALMCKLSPERIKTFSIGVQAEDFNELPYARMVAERYGTEHYEYTVEADLVSTLPAMLWHIEEPVDPFAFGVYTVARLASQHVKVALGGDGGDEMFAGYDRYLGNQLIDLYCLVPAPLRRHIIEPIIHRLPDNFSYNNRVQKLRWMMALSKTSVSERYAASASFLRFSHVHKEALYTSRLWQELGEQDSAGHLMRFFDASNAQQAVDKMLYTDLKTRLPDHLLMIADRMTMAHSLEGRSPYVDHRLVEFVATVPAEYKLRGRTLKYLQREIAREFLPETLVQRPKQGFSFPLAYWFKQELRPLTTTLFQQSRLVEEGYFQAPAMLGLLEEHVEGKVDHNYRLWLLLNLELWHRLFVEGQSADELNELLCTSTNQHRFPHTEYSNGREHKEQIGVPAV